jgi:hypothetical protein
MRLQLELNMTNLPLARKTRARVCRTALQLCASRSQIGRSLTNNVIAFLGASCGQRYRRPEPTRHVRRGNDHDIMMSYEPRVASLNFLSVTAANSADHDRTAMPPSDGSSRPSRSARTYVQNICGVLKRKPYCSPARLSPCWALAGTRASHPPLCELDDHILPDIGLIRNALPCKASGSFSA